MEGCKAPPCFRPGSQIPVLISQRRGQMAIEGVGLRRDSHAIFALALNSACTAPPAASSNNSLLCSPESRQGIPFHGFCLFFCFLDSVTSLESEPLFNVF